MLIASKGRVVGAVVGLKILDTATWQADPHNRCKAYEMLDLRAFPCSEIHSLFSMNAELKVKVVPGASRDEIVGWLEDALKVRVSAPPERGKANAAVCKLLAKQLGLPKGAVTVVQGHGSAHKRLRIEGIDAATLKARLPR